MIITFPLPIKVIGFIAVFNNPRNILAGNEKADEANLTPTQLHSNGAVEKLPILRIWQWAKIY